jgi:hypothetical protein
MSVPRLVSFARRAEHVESRFRLTDCAGVTAINCSPSHGFLDADVKRLLVDFRALIAFNTSPIASPILRCPFDGTGEISDADFIRLDPSGALFLLGP